MPDLLKQELTQRLAEMGERAVAGTGLDLVELELRGNGGARLVRVYIDKPEGVTHADCQLVSQRFSQALDEEDIMPEDSYTLEVSSPGVDRKLVKARDFQRVVGQTIRLAQKSPEGVLKRFEGKLVGLANETLELEIAPEEKVHVPLSQVHKANLKFEW